MRTIEMAAVEDNTNHSKGSQLSSGRGVKREKRLRFLVPKILRLLSPEETHSLHLAQLWEEKSLQAENVHR